MKIDTPPSILCLLQLKWLRKSSMAQPMFNICDIWIESKWVESITRVSMKSKNALISSNRPVCGPSCSCSFSPWMLRLSLSALNWRKRDKKKEKFPVSSYLSCLQSFPSPMRCLSFILHVTVKVLCFEEIFRFLDCEDRDSWAKFNSIFYGLLYNYVWTLPY